MADDIGIDIKCSGTTSVRVKLGKEDGKHRLSVEEPTGFSPLKKKQNNGEPLPPDSVLKAIAEVTEIKLEDDDLADEQICPLCGSSPCEWEEYKGKVLEEFHSMASMGSDCDLMQNERRKKLYRTFTLAKFDFLGAGIRKAIPPCCVNQIRKLCPNEGSQPYMGHYDE